LDRDRTVAFVVLSIAFAEHLIVAVPIILGVTNDVGLVTAGSVGWLQLAVLESIILTLFAAGFGLGFWARLTSAAALAELADARQIIGDQKQVIVEAQDRADELNRVKSGRWTGQTVGRWRLGPVLGRGGMGEVYDGRDAGGSLAAVKVLGAAAEDSPSLVARFSRELQIATRLDSPHIVRVLEVSTASAMVPYLAMERLQGVDLATRLRTQGRMPLNDVVGMLDQVARGLEVAHDAGIVHRDLKPQNLFLHDSTCWKILDFGVAKVFGVEGTLTRDAMVGTPQYMAPEQAVGENVTHLSDVYALGAIAYRCLTGRVPHGAREFTALIYQVIRGAPLRPGTLARVSREVEDVLAVAMAKDPRQRFTSAKEFVEQLTAAANGEPPKVPPPVTAWA
jgi:serine/threonine-protein kinase